MRSTHSADLERWLGVETTEHLSRSMRGWYGPPIALAGVPGNVMACGDGDFIGRTSAGRFASAVDYASDLARRLRRAARVASKNQKNRLNAGFASLEDLISSESGSKQQNLVFNKTGTVAHTTGGANTLWYVGPVPGAGSAPTTAATGTVYSSATSGAISFTNPVSGDTTHFLSGWQVPSVAPQTLLLYDRLWAFQNSNSNVLQTLTGTPSRYQNTGAGADSAAGNFLFVEVSAVLAASAHDRQFTYLNQGGNSSTAPALAGNISSVANSLDHQGILWFAPLEAGDTGIASLSTSQLSTTLSSGVSSVVIGHPIAFLPNPLTTAICDMSSLQTAFNFARIFDEACLSLLEIVKPATTATTYSGSITISAG